MGIGDTAKLHPFRVGDFIPGNPPQNVSFSGMCW